MSSTLLTEMWRRHCFLTGKWFHHNVLKTHVNRKNIIFWFNKQHKTPIFEFMISNARTTVLFFFFIDRRDHTERNLVAKKQHPLHFLSKWSDSSLPDGGTTVYNFRIWYLSLKSLMIWNVLFCFYLHSILNSTFILYWIIKFWHAIILFDFESEILTWNLIHWTANMFFSVTLWIPIIII